MHDHDHDDHELGNSLRRAASPAPFDRDALRARIDATITERGTRAHAARGWRHAMFVWGARVAAALAIFTGGALIGRVSVAPDPRDPVTTAYVPAEILDFSTPRRLSKTAFDAGLGMMLRCPGCEMLVHGEETRWGVPSWPTVEHVVRGGVAEEAGLLPGDEVRRINGRDVRDADGDSPLLAPPRGDFTIDYVREGRPGVAFMNRRIVDQRIVIRGPRVGRAERTKGLGDRLFGTLADVWRGLIGLVSSGPPPRIIVRGDTWGPDRLGLLFRSDSATLFVLDDVNGRQVLRFPGHPIVAAVTDGGPGDRAGLATGDAITHVDGRSVLDLDGATPLFHLEAGRPLAITYQRAGRAHHTTLTPSEER